MVLRQLHCLKPANETTPTLSTLGVKKERELIPRSSDLGLIDRRAQGSVIYRARFMIIT